MNYENMSDEQLNVKLKNTIFGDQWVTESALRKWDFNNPADAWPIIVENKINIDFQYGPWPIAEYDEYIFTDKNPLRAAMVVFLMMQDHKEMDK
jgi:hypothetical protein